MPKRVKKRAKRSKSQDVNEVVADLVRQTAVLSGESNPQVFSAQLSAYMSALGRKGGKIGGKRRMTKMTQEERSRIAFEAATARWDKERAKRKKTG